MDRQTIIDALREQEPELRRRGVTRAALFGSRARGDAQPESDLDVMIDVDPTARFGVYELVGVGHLIGDRLKVKVDVVERTTMRPAFRERVEREAVTVF